MKKALIFILSLFLLSSLNCATTEQEVSKVEEPAPKTEKAKVTVDFDLTDTWEQTEEIDAPKNCGGNRTKTWTVEITQKDDSISLITKERNIGIRLGKIYNNIIKIPGTRFVNQEKAGGLISADDYELKISEDANTLTVKVRWDYTAINGSNCDGVSHNTYKRK